MPAGLIPMIISVAKSICCPPMCPLGLGLIAAHWKLKGHPRIRGKGGVVVIKNV